MPQQQLHWRQQQERHHKLPSFDIEDRNTYIRELHRRPNWSIHEDDPK